MMNLVFTLFAKLSSASVGLTAHLVNRIFLLILQGNLWEINSPASPITTAGICLWKHSPYYKGIVEPLRENTSSSVVKLSCFPGACKII